MDTKPIKDIRKKYNAMDWWLSCEKSMKGTAFGQCAYYMWKAIKEATDEPIQKTD